MKVVITIVVLIIAAAAVYFVCTTRAHAVEHYVCTSPTGAQNGATAVVVDYGKRTATVTGGVHAGTYEAVNVTPDEVAWQKQDEFVFNRHTGRFAVMHNEQNVVSLSTAQCEPASFYDRVVTAVN